MGVDAMKIGVQIRKVMVFLIRTCYRSVCNHPFLVGAVCFLIFLYRSSPFVFSLLVSASPVLVCTAIVLGTLLSFGQPNIPEIEKEEKATTHEISSLKTGVVEDATVVERDENESFETIERHIGKQRDMVENALDEPILVENRGSEVEKVGGSIDFAPLIGVNSREIQFEKRLIEEVEREYNDLELEKKKEVHRERPRIEEKLNDGEFVDNLYSKDRTENLLQEDNKSPGELIDSLKEDQSAFAPVLSWKQGGEDYDDEDGVDDDDSLDSGSDGAESSSPDASMADILPMLDELHPLLELETPQPAHTSHDGSDAGSHRLHKSDDESVDSEEDTDNQGDEGEGVQEGEGEDDNDDDEEEEGAAAKGGKDDESKSAIKWTEVDQKNLMDLGTSEIERNQRLENLIARRRARKNLRLMAEKNLIDLEGADLPFNIPPIATTRRNPFELPDDTYENMAIPGSAPSILLPRRNPFDLPYDSNEEKPDLKGDSFQQEFSVVQHKELVYRRNETFSLGSSFFGGPKQERQDFRWRPYFVPERFSSEEGTAYPTFQRQLSEISESKLSSVPDTESVNSAVDEEDQQSYEQVPEQFSSKGKGYTIFHRQISEISESKVSSVPDTDSVSSAVNEEDKKLNEQEFSRETEGISNRDHGADHVECRSQSSEEVDSVDIEQAEYKTVLHDEIEITLGNVENHQEITSGDVENHREITLGNVENHHEKESSFSGTEGMSTPEEVNANEIYQKTEPYGETSSRSSLSSLSEEDAKVPDMRKEEGSTTLWPGANLMDESVVSTQTLPEESEFHFMSGLTEHREPVYDSSPPGLEKFLSFTSISSDTKLEMSKMGSGQVLLGSAGKESEVHSEDGDGDSSDFEERRAAPSQYHEVYENESISREETFTEANDVDVKDVQSSGADPNFDDLKGSIVNTHPSNIGPLEYTVYLGEHFLPDKLDPATPTYQTTSADSSSSAPKGQVLSMMVEHVLVHPSVSSPETQPVEERAKDKVDPVEVEQGEVHLLSSSDKKSVEEGMADKDGHFQHDADQVYSSSFDADIPNDDHQAASKEQKPPFVTEQVPIFPLSLTSSEADHVQEHAIDKEETHQLEEDQVQSSSQEKIDLDCHPNADAKVDSADFTYENALSEEKSPFELEKKLSWSDKTPSYDDNDAPQEAPIIMTESMKEVNITNDEDISKVRENEEKTLKNSLSLTSNSTSTPFQSPESRSPGGEEVNIIDSGNALEMHDHEHKTLKNSSSSTSDSTSTTPFESPEDKSPGGEDVIDEILDRVVYGDPGHVKEHFDHSVEAYYPHVNEENINGVVDGIREIDEGLLSELDRVGDFSVEEVVDGSLHIQPTPEETNILNTESLPDDSIPLETNLELPILEAKSIQDIVLAFKQLNEGADAEEVILPSMLENQVVEEELKIPGDNNSDLPVVEARSVDDIHAALKQFSQSNLAELSKPLGSNDCAAEVGIKEVGSTEQIESSSNGQSDVVTEESKITGDNNSDLPVVETRSVDDIHAALKQVSQSNLTELSKPWELDDCAAEVEKKEVGSKVQIESSSNVHSDVVAEEFKNPVDNNSDLLVVEARSVDDIHAALKQASQSNPTELPKPLESDDCAAEVEKKEVGSTEQIELSTNGQSDVQENSVTAADELKHVSKEKSETSSLGMSDDRKENTANQDQLTVPAENEAPLIQTENENPKET